MRREAEHPKVQKAEKNENLLEAEGLNVFYREKRKRRQVLWDIHMEIRKNEIVGLVGESGCGKSTLAKAFVGLNRDYTGEIRNFCGQPQMIFQDPYSSLNPFYTVGRLLEEPLLLQGEKDRKECRSRALEMLAKVGLNEDFYGRKPRELSGGQRQRVSIGMALIGAPALVAADEPVSALDVTVRAQIMDLLLNLQEEMHNSYLFISHDMDVIYHMCDRIMVMQGGRIVEEGPVEKVFEAPENEYTKMLLDFWQMSRVNAKKI